MLRAVATFWRKAYDDNLTGMAAMVAYNLMLSVFPLALVALFVAGRVLASEDIEASVVDDLQRLFPDAADSTLVDGLRRVRESSTTVGIVAVIAATWFSCAFWGALDTAFCRIYHRECRSWVRQKLFGLGMLLVVMLFFVATVSIPALQALVVVEHGGPAAGARRGARAGLRGDARWRPAAAVRDPLPRLLARAARTDPLALRLARRARRAGRDGRSSTTRFPLYLSNVTSLRVGTSFLFVLIVLVWFYVLALILLAGAVVNELRFEGRRA